MGKLLAFSVFALSFLFSQSPSPSIAGVWKADLQKSKIPGPPITDYLSIYEEKTVVVNRRTQEKGPEIDETTGTWGGPRGEQRTALSFLVNGKSVVRPYEGVPTQLTASWQGNTLSLTAETAGQPQVMKRTYELSPDGQTLTVTTTTTARGKEMQSVVFLVKQPDSAGEPLRKPEEVAEAHFKNVKTELKRLPVSEFINNMRYFSWSLGKDCEFCHVKNQFDSDDKKEKKTAREMIDMTAHIDADNFKNRPEVRCFTCHEGHNHPLSYPLFPDQIAAMQSNQNGPAATVGAPSNTPTPHPPQ
jgi:Photosynthetic reaction centre cytochrome C subunit